MLSREPRWPMFHRVWRRAELTDRMVCELGINPIAAVKLDDGQAYREACITCLTCAAPNTCRNWLNSESRLPVSSEFCPNSRFFERCLEHQSDPN